MKILDTEFVPETTRSIVVGIECDMCKDRTNRDWQEKSFEVIEIKLEMSEGESYPEGGSGKEIHYDICPKCFKEKIIPFLQSEGADREWVEWEF